jgi:hypothetical protein
LFFSYFIFKGVFIMMKKEDVQKLIGSTKNPMFNLIFKMMGYDRDTTIKNLKEMEHVINTLYPLGHQPEVTTVISFGLALGDTLVKNIPGAEWVIEDLADIFDMRIKLENGDVKTEARPLLRMRKFWFDRTDTLFGWAEMVRDIVMGDVNLEGKEDIWHIRPNGTTIRMKKFTKEEFEQMQKEGKIK